MSQAVEAVVAAPPRTQGWFVLAPLLCALLAVATYACSLRGTYMLDDTSSVIGDARVTQGQYREFWTQGYRRDGFDKLYRPLVCTSFALEWRLHGDRVWLFHLVNILLHGAVTGVLTALAYRMMGGRPALIAGLLFAVLPIHTEAVVNIVGRAECMCALGVLCGLLAFITMPLDWRLMVVTSVCFLFAACSKEQGILFPLILLAAVPLRSAQRIPPADQETRRLFVVVILFLTAGYLIFRESMVHMWWDRSIMFWDCNPIIRSQGIDRLLLPIVVFGHYVQLTLAPAKLSFDYSGNVIGWHVRLSDPYLYLGFASGAALLISGICSIFAKRWSAFLAIGGLVVTYGLIGNIVVVIGTLMNERLAYLPSAFFLLLVAGPIARLPKPALVGVVTLVVGLWAACSVSYAERWNEPRPFLEWSVRTQPDGKFNYMALYAEYGQHGEWESALRLAQDLRARMPDSPQAHYMVMSADMQLGRWADAKKAAEYGESQPFIEQDKLLMKWTWTDADEKLRQAAEARQPASRPETRP